MKIFYRILLFCILLIPFAVYVQERPDGWVLKKEADGVMVYNRKTHSAVKEILVVTYLKTSLQSLVAFILDFERYPEWVYECGKSVTLKKVSDTEIIHYQTALTPWPLKNRDVVVNTVVSQDTLTKVVSIKSVGNSRDIPEDPDYVRITDINVVWTMIPLSDGRIKISEQIAVDPAGHVPAWLVNLESTEGPYKSIIKFREKIMEERYQNARIPIIKELKVGN